MKPLLKLGCITSRRSAVRYKLQLPVIFHWNDGEDHTAGGFTCDVAVDGALIHSSVMPPVGCVVRIEVLVPSPETGREYLRIECSGNVMRTVCRNGIGSFGVRGMFDDNRITNQMVSY